jgi:hypothetical protein
MLLATPAFGAASGIAGAITETKHIIKYTLRIFLISAPVYCSYFHDSTIFVEPSRTFFAFVNAK